MNNSKHAIDVLGAYLTQSLHARRKENVEITIQIPGHMNTFGPNFTYNRSFHALQHYQNFIIDFAEFS